MPVIRREVGPVTNKPLRREGVGRLCGQAAAALYRLISKKRRVVGRSPCAVLQQSATKTGCHEEATRSLRQ